MLFNEFDPYDAKFDLSNYVLLTTSFLLQLATFPLLFHLPDFYRFLLHFFYLWGIVGVDLVSADDGLEDDVGYAIIEGCFTMLGWSVVEVCLPGRNRRSYAIIQYNLIIIIESLYILFVPSINYKNINY